MADLHFKIRADVSELEKAYKVIDDFEQKIVNINKSLGGVQPGGKKFKELAKELTELEKQYEKSIKRIAELENVVSSLNESQKLVTITKEVTTTTNEATQVFVKYAGSLEELDRRVKELTKEYLSMNAAQKASSQGQSVINEISILNSQRKIEADSLRALQKEYVNTQRMQDLQEGSITALRAQLSQLTATYDNMGRSMRNSASGKELIGSIQLVTTELNEAEQASMRFNRNVGNYASGWNGLSMQVQQVARELPAMAMGANTFFLAISNNLPMLADEIKRAKTEYKAFVAEGKNAKPVWKQVASSLFSWQTALVAGVTILSIYGKEIISWVGSLFTAKKALSETYQSLEDYQKKVGESSGSVIATLEKLSNGWKRLGSDVDAQKKYIIDNKDAINSMGVSVTDAAEAERLFNTNKDTFILGILQRAKAAATMELAAEEYKKAVQKMMEADTMSDKKTHKYSNATNIVDLFKSSTWQTVEYDNPDKVKAKKQAEAFIKSGTELVQKYIQFSDEEKKYLQSMNVRLTDTMVEGSVEAIEAAIALKQQSLKKITDPKDYKRIEAEIKAEQAKLKAITGDKEKINNYKDSYAQTKEIEKASQSVKDAVLKSETDILQSQIELMDEGTTKQLSQIRLSYEKRFAEIQKGEREALQLLQNEERKQWEKKNPDYKKKNLQFVPTITKLPEEEQGKFGTQYSLAYQQQEKDANNLLKNLLSKYQDYATQRLAIEKQFNADIAILQEERKRAQESGDTGKVEITDRAIAQATTDKGKALIGLDYDKLKEAPEYVRAFENLKETSSETLNSLLSQLENAKTAAAKVLSPDQLREYTTTIQDIMNELDERNPWQALSDKKQELADAEQELSDAQIALENARQTAEAVKGGAKIESGVKSSSFNKETGKIDSTKAYLTEAQALENVKEKTDNYNKSKDNAVKANSKLKKAEKDVTEQIDELAKAIKDVGNSIGGPAGEIIALIGDIGTFAITAMNGIEAVSNTTATAISTVEKASVILMIISAAIQIATKMLDLFGGDDTTEKYESTKEAYESYINILDQVIDKQLEMAESLSGASAQAAYNKAIELVKTQSEAARVLGKQYLNSGASWKSSSKGKKEVDDMSYEGWADAAKALGMSVDQIKNSLGGRMDGLFDLTDAQLAKLQGEAHIFWAQLDSDTQDYANQIAEGVEKVAEVIEQRMADVTLIDVDTLRSDFHDLLTDMDAGTAEFAGNFEEYMKNAILNSMLKEQYMGKLTEWRKKFYAAMDGGMTEEEYDALKAEGQQISDEMKADRDKMKDMYGWTSGESSSQDSTNGGFQTMSQDEGKEMNGRFTAFQISNEEIKNQSVIQTGFLSKIYESMNSVSVGEAIAPIFNLNQSITNDKVASTVGADILLPQMNVIASTVTELKATVDEMLTKQVEQMIDVNDIADGANAIVKNLPTFLVNSEATKNSCKSFAGK